MSHRWKRPREEVIASLRDQLKWLDVSCSAYDQGDKSEAARLATIVETVVHDGGKKVRSILTQLGIRGSLRFVTSGFPRNPKNEVREMNLVAINIGDGPTEYVPILDKYPMFNRLTQFHVWWNDDQILTCSPEMSPFIG